MFFFALIPILDAVLFLAAAADLYRGAAATMAHAVAAVYIGVSVAFGKSMIQWADERFRYYVVKEGQNRSSGTDWIMPNIMQKDGEDMY